MKTKNGFTLMELLVAIAILSIISISCYVAFDTALKSWRKSEARVERYQNARAALDMIAKDFQGAFISSVNSNIYRLMENAFGIYLTTNAISVTTDIYRVGYTWVGSGSSLVKGINLNYDVSTPDPTYAVGKIDQSSNLLLSEGLVTDLSFDYGYYNSSGSLAWTNNEGITNDADSTGWDSYNDNGADGFTNYTKAGTTNTKHRLPQAIRIGLAVRDEKSYEAAQSFYTIVYLPNAE